MIPTPAVLWTVRLPGLPPTPNRLLRMHWSGRRQLQKLWTERLWMALLEQGQRCPEVPFRSATLLCTRLSTTEPDPDALAGSFKLLIDSLLPLEKRGLGWIVDDSPAHLTLVTGWRRAKRGQGAVEMHFLPEED